MTSTIPQHPPTYEELLLLYATLPHEYIDSITPERGTHASRADGVCIMELTAWAAGDVHTELPSCACSTLTEILTHWNDTVPQGVTTGSVSSTTLFKPSLVPTPTPKPASDAIWPQPAARLSHHLPTWLSHAGFHRQAHTIRTSALLQPHPDEHHLAFLAPAGQLNP